MAQETLPLTCFATAGGPTTCAELEQLVSQDTTVESLSCSGSDVCHCQLSVSRAGITTAGTYMTSGTTLSTTESTGSSSGLEYCVKGNQLHLIGLATTMSMGVMGDATVASDTVLQRQ